MTKLLPPNAVQTATKFFRRGDFATGLHSGEVGEFVSTAFGNLALHRRAIHRQDVEGSVDKRLSRIVEALDRDKRVAGMPEAERKERLNWLKESPTIREGLLLLEQELGPRKDLHYHGSRHTWDVLYHFSIIAMNEKLSFEDFKLGAIAAVSHDLGFIRQNRSNESFGVACLMHLKPQIVSEFKNDPEQKLNLMAQAILDTRMFEVPGYPGVYLHHLTDGPHTSFAASLLDADVANLGRHDFIKKGVRVHAELEKMEKAPKFAAALATEKGRKFFSETLEMLKQHSFKTDSAQRLLGRQKERNKEVIEKAIAQISSF